MKINMKNYKINKTFFWINIFIIIIILIISLFLKNHLNENYIKLIIYKHNKKEKIYKLEDIFKKVKYLYLYKGNKKIGAYYPSSCMSADKKTVFLTYTIDGKNGSYVKKSVDNGTTWETLIFPQNNMWKKMTDFPTIYNLVDKQGHERLIIFCNRGEKNTKNEYNIHQTISNDNGKTWSKVKDLGNKFQCNVAFTSIIKLKNGDYMGVFHTDKEGKDINFMYVLKSISNDGGLTWSDPIIIAKTPRRYLAEPCLIYSPDKKQIVCLMRDNIHGSHYSAMMVSNDEGKTWSSPISTLPELTGDRHVVRHLPNGRLIITYRYQLRDAQDKLQAVAWIGTYNDIIKKRKGKLIKLIDSCAINGYSAIEILPNKKLLIVVYAKEKENQKYSLISIKCDL